MYVCESEADTEGEKEGRKDCMARAKKREGNVAKSSSITQEENGRCRFCLGIKRAGGRGGG